VLWIDLTSQLASDEQELRREKISGDESEATDEAGVQWWAVERMDSL